MSVLPLTDIARIALAAPRDMIPVRSLSLPTYQARLKRSPFGLREMLIVPVNGAS